MKDGVMSKGFGLIPQMIMRDKTLSVEAKAIYAYLAAFAGNTYEAFPSVELICDELNISKKRYLNHRQHLIDKGYVEIERKRGERGFSKNVYKLAQRIEKQAHMHVEDTRLLPLQHWYDEKVGQRNAQVNDQLSSLLKISKDPLLIIEALNIAVQHGTKLFPYAKGVLRNLAQDKGITSYEQFINKQETPSFGGHQLPF